MLNKVILIGNLGQDPDVRQFETNSVASFSLATSESYIDKTGQKQTITEWHRINVWGKAAETVQKYLKKGSKVYVEGKITYRKYTDAQGVERNVTEVKSDNFRFLDSASSSEAKKDTAKEDELYQDNGELPF